MKADNFTLCTYAEHIIGSDCDPVQNACHFKQKGIVVHGLYDKIQCIYFVPFHSHLCHAGNENQHNGFINFSKLMRCFYTVCTGKKLHIHKDDVIIRLVFHQELITRVKFADTEGYILLRRDKIQPGTNFGAILRIVVYHSHPQHRASLPFLLSISYMPHMFQYSSKP